ncbi:TIGR04104 family putative zinc finger protein [Sporosarcina sp. FA9]|uniref:TIGR04104 family putative zinc finger protein n=1 Tax=Sporosarcina sp. FA9 TaxID=3413030 RepID=UPI003F65D777
MGAVLIIQKCQNCNRSFSWREIYNSFLGWIYKPIECDNCGAKHKITIPGRFIFVSLTILPMLTFVNYLSPFTNFTATLGVGLVLLLIGTLLTPYFVRFKVVRNERL